MSEVTKRDKRVMLLNQLLSIIARERADASAAKLAVWRTQLQNEWEKFEELHDKVVDRAGAAEIKEQHTIYDNAFVCKYKADLMLEELRIDLEGEADAQVHNEAMRNVNVLKRRHDVIRARLSTMCNAILNDVAAIQQMQVDIQLKRIEALFVSFQDIGLERIANGEVQDAILAAEEDVVALYLNASGALKQVQHDAAQPMMGGQQLAHEADALKLPPLSITPFDGKGEKWEAFRESFEHGIHARANLPAVQKLQYLKSVLQGEPEELIRNFGLTAANYDSAWRLLNQRYNNRRELIISHLRVITTLPACSASADELRTIANRTASARMALTNLGRPTGQWDDWIVFHVSERLDKESRRMWEQGLEADALTTWDDLDRFIQGRIRALASIGCTQPVQRQKHTYSNKQCVHHNSSASQESMRTYNCPVCSESHLITFCDQFRRQSVEDRRRIAAEKQLCFICLAQGHMAHQCNSTRSCQTCNAKHNTLLHPTEHATAEHGLRSHAASVALGNSQRTRPPVLLATAMVNVRSNSGQLHTVRALLDQGGEGSFISKRLAHALQLSWRRDECDLSGIGGVKAGRAKYSMVVEVSDCCDNGFAIDVDAFILPRVTGELRCLPDIDVVQWPHIAGLTLADPDLMNPNAVEIVIGSDYYGKVLLPGLRKEDGYPTAQLSYFGWLISGAIERRQQGRGDGCSASNAVRVHHASLDAQLTRFWEIEETSTARRLTAAEEKCEAMFESTVARDDRGRIHVRLPMAHDEVIFGESQRFAVQRQLQIERRFEKDDDFAQQYRQFMLQYEQLGHMRAVDGAVVDMSGKCAMLPPSRREYYIPHHAVLKDSSTTTKLRVVFDASRKTTNGTSLNEQMLIGPRLQDELTSIMMRWRRFRVAFCADIEKMYRQIVVDDPDADLQRIVWRARATDLMCVYQLCTVTYGTASAPYLAVKSLQTLATLERDRFPLGAALALNNFYVDDVLGGADTIADCVEAQVQLKELMASGGMNLRKWASNSEEVLAMVDAADRESSLPLNFEDGANVSTLGVQWHPASDELSFKVEMPTLDDGKKWTKRTFLSAAARLFDPLGWLAPCTIVIKIMFQSLWKIKVEWDDELPLVISKKWNEVRATLGQLEAIRITRWIHTTNESNVELHGFCDASMVAYAATVFLRVKDENREPYVINLCAKTKVAPIKTISLPRLELCGALLLVRLLNDVKNAMQWQTVKITCWTDSTIVLAWLRGHPSAFNVFVANRAAEIQRTFVVDRTALAARRARAVATATGFIAAYERFTARRGMCTDLYSDNATNYVGAAKFLRSERERFNATVQATMADVGTTWHFSPPLSPHFNGLAEAAIRSMKHHLRRVIGETTLTFEELSTMLAKIEACLNSRPLCAINADPDSFDVLTPGHFLIGESFIGVPQDDLIDRRMSALTRWQLTHQFVQRVWKRWASEYLHTLQQRWKWQQPHDDVRIGDLVLILDDNLPPAKWAVGRITATHPGDDGRVRVVTLRTKGATYKRAVAKVARLPIDIEPQEAA